MAAGRVRLPWRRIGLAAWASVFVLALADVWWGVFSYRATNAHIVREVGLFPYAVYDVVSHAWRQLFDHLDDVDPAAYAHFLEARRAAWSLDEQPPARRKNIVFLQLESMDAATLDATLDGGPVMPFTRALRERGWVFENALDQTAVGRSSDAHVLVITSQIPIQNQPVFTRYDLSHVRSLPKLLAPLGYRSMSFEGYQAEFWRWKSNHQRMGYHASFSMTELDASEQLGWGISDRSVVEQAVQQMVASTRPFFAHIMTLTNHHPFPFVRESVGAPARGIVNDYLLSARYVDGVVKLLYDRLEQHGLLEDTIVAVYADHDSGITEELLLALGRPYRAGVEHERIPLIVTGLGPPRVIRRPVGLADLAPTVLLAVGAPVPRALVGTPLQSAAGSVLLPNRTRVTGVDGDGLAVVEPVHGIELETLTRLAIQRPQALPD